MCVSALLARSRPAYKTVAFSERFTRHLESRGVGNAAPSRAVTAAEAVTLAAKLRDAGVPVADDAVILRVHTQNPEVIRLAPRDDGGEPAFLAYLPLRANGLDALVRGTLNRKDPAIELLCRSGEIPAALYLWCIYTPGRLMPAMTSIVAHFDAVMPSGIPMFTSAATSPAARLFTAMGFVRAVDVFPQVEPDVLVILPRQGADAHRS